MAFTLVNPEVGFTSDVIKDPNRFVGRSILIRDSIAALNSSLGLIAIYGRRGVGKSSLTRQVQALAKETMNYLEGPASFISYRRSLENITRYTINAIQ